MVTHESADLPPGSVLDRVTDEFDETSVPKGLLRAHRVAAGAWGRLVVRQGALRFVFEDSPDEPIHVEIGGSVVIPPGRLHHVETTGPVRFAVEFHVPPAGAADA